MKNVIFGTGKFAGEVAKKLESYNINIDAFVNNKTNLPTDVYNNKPIINIDNLDFTNSDFNIIVAKKPMFMGSAIEYLKNKNFRNSFLIKEEIFFNSIKDIEDLQNYLLPVNFSDKAILNYLETNIVDNCNLNCKGCAHFSNICRPYFVTPEDLAKDLYIINNHFHLLCFRLLGGEPLIHPKLDEIVKVARAMLPKTELVLVTNGILIPKINREIIDSLRDNNVIVSISLYKPTEKLLSKIIERLNKENIKYFINDDYFKKPEVITQFHTRLSTEKNNEGSQVSQNCGGRFCRFLRDGKISKCYYPLLINNLNDLFNTDFTISEDDFITLSEITDGWEAIEQLNRPISFCDYCRSKEQNFEWRRANKNVAKLDDYVLKLKKK